MHSHIKHIISTCGAIICYENAPTEDQIKVLRIKLNRNKVLPEVILELLCGEAWAVPDMKNSPATIRFFSDAEWNSPISAGGVVCDTEGVSERVPQLPVLVWLKPVKTAIRLDKKASVRESLYIKCESAECSQHPDSTPVWWPQSAAPTPLHHARSCFRVGHLGSCSCILTQRGFVQGAELLSGHLLLMWKSVTVKREGQQAVIMFSLAAQWILYNCRTYFSL